MSPEARSQKRKRPVLPDHPDHLLTIISGHAGELVLRELDRLLNARSLGPSIAWHVVRQGDP